MMFGRIFAILIVAFGLLGAPLASAREAPPAEGPVAVPPYRLGSGDKVRVIVFGEPALSGQFSIEARGAIALPLVGQIEAAGREPRELETLIADRLRGDYVNNPKVSVEVLEFRPFYILGEVARPGQYPYVPGLTALSAVATAQGFTPRANKKKVQIRHLGAPGETTYRLTPSTPVLPGDTIRITERFF
jgi:protein involved in polysaccharide export with SLBB domain